MEWRGEGLVIRTRHHGEGNAIIDVFTRTQGRYVGLVRGGNSRKQRPILQEGNMVAAVWRARLSEQLGVMTAEISHAYSAEVLDNRVLLTALQSLCALLQITPERQAYTRLYDTAQLLLSSLSADDIIFWLSLYVRFEMILLEEIGFGLDMNACAVSGVTEGLTHISPRSGRAVCAQVAAPYEDKLLPLPPFLLAENNPATLSATLDDILAGLALTGYFLERRCYAPNQMTLPPIRMRLLDILKK